MRPIGGRLLAGSNVVKESSGPGFMARKSWVGKQEEQREGWREEKAWT